MFQEFTQKQMTELLSLQEEFSVVVTRVVVDLGRDIEFRRDRMGSVRVR